MSTKLQETKVCYSKILGVEIVLVLDTTQFAWMAKISTTNVLPAVGITYWTKISSRGNAETFVFLIRALRVRSARLMLYGVL